MRVHVVVIGTSGNQRYIFASNKRRENVGASHLITRVEGAWLDAALRRIGASHGRSIDDQPAEVVTANAGAITALVRDKAIGRALVSEVTRLALIEAPGMDVCGAVGESVEYGDAAELAAAIRSTRALLPAASMSRPGPQSRFPGLPLVARCDASGSPAHRMWPSDRRRDGTNGAAPSRNDKPERSKEAAGPRSAASISKLDAYGEARSRLAADLGIAEQTQERAPESMERVVEYLADRAEWVAVVHADGNGMGEVFGSFDTIMEQLGESGAREYVDSLRKLSEGVDRCARDAVRTVVRELKTPCRACREADRGAQDGTRHADSCRLTIDGEAPVLPLVLGGDDLTVLCDGSLALPFAERYLTEFARLAARDDDVGVLLRRAGRDPLGACAGVAIVKRHYPFHSATGLAEDLTREAKRVKTILGSDRCAVSFHVLYESAAADLDRLRSRMRSLDGARLTAQPYVVGTADRDDTPTGWSSGRRWSDLRRRVTALTRTNAEGARDLPAGQAHDLRAGLFLRRAEADARFSLVLGRLEDPDVEAALEGDRGSLFWSDGDTAVTGLLDAMDAAPFLTCHELDSERTEARR